MVLGYHSRAKSRQCTKFSKNNNTLRCRAKSRQCTNFSKNNNTLRCRGSYEMVEITYKHFIHCWLLLVPKKRALASSCDLESNVGTSLRVPAFHPRTPSKCHMGGAQKTPNKEFTCPFIILKLNLIISSSCKIQ